MISTSKNTLKFWSDTVSEYAFDLLRFCVSERTIYEKSSVPKCKNYFTLKPKEILDQSISNIFKLTCNVFASVFRCGLNYLHI